MTKKNLYFALFIFAALAFVSQIPKMAEAGLQNPYLGAQVEGREVAGIDQSGYLFTSSGILSDVPLFLFHEEFIDLPAASTTAVRADLGGISTTTLLNSATTFSQGNFIQPSVPRTLRLSLAFASGTVVVVGSNTWGVAIRETVAVTSGSHKDTLQAFSFVSSVTVNVSSVSWNPPGLARFTIGTSTGIGITNPISASTDVIKLSQNHIVNSTMTINTTYYTFAPQDPDGSNDYRIWYYVRKTIRLLLP